MLKPFAATDGGKPQAFLSHGFVSMNVLKKASPERIKELLRIMNYLAAPFGSQEDLLLSYGLKDQDYTLDDKGNPMPNPEGMPRASYVPWRYIAQHPWVNYQADLPGFAKASYEAQQMLMPIGVERSDRRLLLADRLGKGQTADVHFQDGVIDIILGRRPVQRVRRPGQCLAERGGRHGPQRVHGRDGRGQGMNQLQCTERRRMLKQEENELITSSRPWHADGQLHARVLGAGDALVRAADARLRSAAGDAARRAADRLPRHATARSACCQNHCPHRGASLFFGRNEEAGLRCVYHGWKFDVARQLHRHAQRAGRESTSRPKVKAVAYPCQERGGVVWTYMGPRSTPPPLPDLEGNMQPNADEFVRATQLKSNWLQILEGDIDTTPRRVPALRRPEGRGPDPGQLLGVSAARQDRPLRGHRHRGRRGVRRPRRPAGPDQVYWRIAQFCFPFYTFTPPGVLGTKKGGNARVPDGRLPHA